MSLKYTNAPNVKPKKVHTKVAENITEDFKIKHSIKLLAKLMKTEKGSKEEAQILKRLGK